MSQDTKALILIAGLFVTVFSAQFIYLNSPSTSEKFVKVSQTQKPLQTNPTVNKKENSTNYCHDKERIEEWEILLAKYPEEPDIIKLYSLRVGLCMTVDNKKVQLDDAIDLFNAERNKVYLKWLEAQQFEEKQHTL